MGNSDRVTLEGEAETHAAPGPRRRLLVLVAVVLAAVAFGVVLPRIAGYGSVWHVLRGLSPVWLAPLLAAVAANVVTFAPPWMIALPGLGLLDAIKMTQATTAMTLVVPGGAPLGMGASYAMLRSVGFRGAEVGRAVALTGIWNQLSTFLFPVVGAAAVASEGGGGTAFEVTAALGAALFVVGAIVLAGAFASGAVAERLGTVLGLTASAVQRLRRREARTPTAVDVERFRGETFRLLRSAWPRLTVATALNQLTGFLIFDLSLRAVGIGYGSVSVAESFAAWSIGRLIASLPVTPGGLGLVELGLTGTLVGFGGAHAEVVAAVLVYRVLSIAPTLVLGLLATGTWRSRA